MSTVYNHEPPTKGKVVLHTTMGDIEVELWPKEAPKAVRNFCQLCMEGYYDNTIFHRIVKDFMIQGGDPTGQGQGGESIYGHPFKDEFHSRLRFTHRGLVACANRNAPGTNGSQFFITLERCDHLDRKNTIFGRVAGDTIFNAVRISEVDVDDDDRPTDPPRITSVDVIMPPFDDLTPRTTPAELAAAVQAKQAQQRAIALAERKKKGKALSKLSFGDEAEEEEEELERSRAELRFRSAHETIDNDRRLENVAPGAHDEEIQELKRRLAQEQAAKQAIVREEEAKADTLRAIKDRANTAAADESGKSFAESMLEKAQARAAAWGSRDKGRDADGSAKEPRDLPPAPNGGAARDSGARPGSGSDESDADSDEEGAPARRKVDKLTISKAGKGAAAQKRTRDTVQDAELLTSYQLSLAKFKQRKRAKGDREKETMTKFSAFAAALRQKPQAAKPGAAGDSGGEGVRMETAAGVEGGESSAGKEAAGGAGADSRAAGEPLAATDEGYSGKVNKKIDHRSYLPAAWRVDTLQDTDDEDDYDVANLRGHAMTYDANDGVADPTKRRDNVDDYTVIDPLLEAGKAKFNKQQHHAKKRQNEWAGRANL